MKPGHFTGSLLFIDSLLRVYGIMAKIDQSASVFAYAELQNEESNIISSV